MSEILLRRAWSFGPRDHSMRALVTGPAKPNDIQWLVVVRMMCLWLALFPALGTTVRTDQCPALDSCYHQPSCSLLHCRHRVLPSVESVLIGVIGPPTWSAAKASQVPELSGGERGGDGGISPRATGVSLAIFYFHSGCVFWTGCGSPALL